MKTMLLLSMWKYVDNFDIAQEAQIAKYTWELNIQVLLENVGIFSIMSKHFYSRHEILQRCLKILADNMSIQTRNGDIRVYFVIVISLHIQRRNCKCLFLKQKQEVGILFGKEYIWAMSFLQDFASRIVYLNQLMIPLVLGIPALKLHKLH